MKKNFKDQEYQIIHILLIIYASYCKHYNMKFKYMFIASLILAILMVGAVSATDTISEDNISDADDDTLEITENDVYTTGGIHSPTWLMK